MSALERVTKEQAVKLKEAGYGIKEDCDKFYNIEERSDKLYETIDYGNGVTPDWGADAPTLSEACKWLRDTKKALIHVFPIDDWEHYGCSVLFPGLSAPFYEREPELIEYPTYEAAQSAGLDVALDFKK